jgi:hypothetical protein
MRPRRLLLGAVAAATALIAGLAVLGQSRTTHVITVARPTTASPQAIWQLWADAPNRTRWDAGLEWARLDGRFERGATGEVKLHGQPPRRFEIIEHRPPNQYTDRFFLPLGTTMDWHHLIEERAENTRQVTFRVVVQGPSSLLLTPVLRNILDEELPATVDNLVKLAEQARTAA